MANVLDASIETFLSSDENVDHQLLVKARSATSVNAVRMKRTLEKKWEGWENWKTKKQHKAHTCFFISQKMKQPENNSKSIMSWCGSIGCFWIHGRFLVGNFSRC